MGMGKRAAPPPAAPKQEAVGTPTVADKSISDAQADENAAANLAARAEENQSATLLQTKDDELMKKQTMLG